jgi:hypothetical protein
MSANKLLCMTGALVLLVACEARLGGDDRQSNDASGVAEGKGAAEEGTFSIDTPGLQMKLDIPTALAERAEVDSENGLLYPGSNLSGIHVQSPKGRGRTTVELRFTSSDALERVVAWYRDPARADDFAISSQRQDGDITMLAGTQKDDGDPFELILSRKNGGGTDGRLKLRDRG